MRRRGQNPPVHPHTDKPRQFGPELQIHAAVLARIVRQCADLQPHAAHLGRLQGNINKFLSVRTGTNDQRVNILLIFGHGFIQRMLIEQFLNHNRRLRLAAHVRLYDGHLLVGAQRQRIDRVHAQLHQGLFHLQQQFFAALKSLARIARQTLLQNARQAGHQPDIGIGAGTADQFRISHQARNALIMDRIKAARRHIVGNNDALKQHGAHGINVRPVVRTAAQHLRRAIAGRAAQNRQSAAHAVQCIDVKQRNAVAVDLHIAVVVHQKIRRLDIQMQQARRVHRLDAIHQRIYRLQNIVQLKVGCCRRFAAHIGQVFVKALTHRPRRPDIDRTPAHSGHADDVQHLAILNIVLQHPAAGIIRHQALQFMIRAHIFRAHVIKPAHGARSGRQLSVFPALQRIIPEPVALHGVQGIELLEFSALHMAVTLARSLVANGGTAFTNHRQHPIGFRRAPVPVGRQFNRLSPLKILPIDLFHKQWLLDHPR